MAADGTTEQWMPTRPSLRRKGCEDSGKVAAHMDHLEHLNYNKMIHKEDVAYEKNWPNANNHRILVDPNHHFIITLLYESKK